MRVRVKICGITRVEDARAAAAAGADAVGLVFCRDSPRCVDPGLARFIARAIPPFVSRVGVFVDAAPDEIRDRIRDIPLDAVQLHGDESPAACRGLPARVIKGFRIRDAASLSQLAAYADVADAVLLDAWSGTAPGGTGTAFDWSLACRPRTGLPLILTGGLTPGNVAGAIRVVRPWGVDVSSGVESAPGLKDHARIREFVEQCIGQRNP